MMAQSFARFGRITNVPSAATDRLKFPAPATVETRCRCGEPRAAGAVDSGGRRAARGLHWVAELSPAPFTGTLHDASIDRIAVLRLDGDLSESTIQALDALYPRLSPGGFASLMTTCLSRVGKLSRTTAHNMEYPRRSLTWTGTAGHVYLDTVSRYRSYLDAVAMAANGASAGRATRPAARRHPLPRRENHPRR